MNKQELIDKTVRDLNGKWPNIDECFAHERIYSHTSFCGEISSISHYYCGDIKKQEFQQRAKELGYGADDPGSWFDYESQKAIKLPPVGVESEYLGNNGEWCSVKTVYLSEYVIVLEKHIMGDIVQVAFNFGHFPELRALDWNRKAEQERIRVETSALNVLNNPEINKTIEISFALASAVRALYDAGFLKLPEQKDEK